MNVNPFGSRANLFRCGRFLTPPGVRFREKPIAGLRDPGIRRGAAAGLAGEGEGGQHRRTVWANDTHHAVVRISVTLAGRRDEVPALCHRERFKEYDPPGIGARTAYCTRSTCCCNSINAWPICLAEQWRRAWMLFPVHSRMAFRDGESSVST